MNNQIQAPLFRIAAASAGILMLLLAAAPLIHGQAAQATVDFALKDNVITITVQSPVSVAKFQISITTSTTYSVNPSTAKLSGFLQGATQLTNTESGSNEHRWFNLNAQPSQTGTLTLPASPLTGGAKLSLIKVDLQDASGNTIAVSGTLPRDPVILTTTVTTTTATTTALSTVTATVTSVATTATVTATQTATTTLPVTVTNTVTAPAGTVTSTVTRTTTIQGAEGISQTALIVIAILAIIVVVLLVLGMRRRPA
ncbi:MAG: hypothetical protein HYU39_05755 [Thaumarchaeota archaeon]|nr:hypothetical protein [Nitrososphaerota archaeon]